MFQWLFPLVLNDVIHTDEFFAIDLSTQDITQVTMPLVSESSLTETAEAAVVYDNSRTVVLKLACLSEPPGL